MAGRVPVVGTGPEFLILLSILKFANAHHHGMNQHHKGGSPRFRQLGVLTTWLTMVVLALWILFLFATKHI